MTRHATAVPARRDASVPRPAVAIALATLLALLLAACSGTGATISPESPAGSRAEGLVVDGGRDVASRLEDAEPVPS